MSKKFFIALFFLSLLIGIPGSASALIINVDAVSNNASNPSGQVIDVFLSAGTYDVNLIGVADGGAYDAWDAWGTTHTWVNSYEYYSDEFGKQGYWDGVKYATAVDALNHAIASSFTLTSDAYVSFFNSDPGYTDNLGGVSLNVTKQNAPVPEPATLILFGTGLIGLTSAGRRKCLGKKSH